MIALRILIIILLMSLTAWLIICYATKVGSVISDILEGLLYVCNEDGGGDA